MDIYLKVPLLHAYIQFIAYLGEAASNGEWYIKNMPFGKKQYPDAKLAEIMGLPDAAAYTSHCFRRTALTLLANAGTTETEMMGVSG